MKNKLGLRKIKRPKNDMAVIKKGHTQNNLIRPECAFDQMRVSPDI